MIFGYEYQWNSNTKINGIYIQKQLKFMSTNQWNSFIKTHWNSCPQINETYISSSMKSMYKKSMEIIYTNNAIHISRSMKC